MPSDSNLKPSVTVNGLRLLYDPSPTGVTLLPANLWVLHKPALTTGSDGVVDHVKLTVSVNPVPFEQLVQTLLQLNPNIKPAEVGFAPFVLQYILKDSTGRCLGQGEADVRDGLQSVTFQVPEDTHHLFEKRECLQHLHLFWVSTYEAILTGEEHLKIAIDFSKLKSLASYLEKTGHNPYHLTALNFTVATKNKAQLTETIATTISSMVSVHHIADNNGRNHSLNTDLLNHYRQSAYEQLANAMLQDDTSGVKQKVLRMLDPNYVQSVHSLNANQEQNHTMGLKKDASKQVSRDANTSDNESSNLDQQQSNDFTDDQFHDANSISGAVAASFGGPFFSVGGSAEFANKGESISKYTRQHARNNLNQHAKRNLKISDTFREHGNDNQVQNVQEDGKRTDSQIVAQGEVKADADADIQLNLNIETKFKSLQDIHSVVKGVTAQVRYSGSICLADHLDKTVDLIEDEEFKSLKEQMNQLVKQMKEQQKRLDQEIAKAQSNHDLHLSSERSLLFGSIARFCTPKQVQVPFQVHQNLPLVKYCLINSHRFLNLKQLMIYSHSGENIIYGAKYEESSRSQWRDPGFTEDNHFQCTVHHEPGDNADLRNDMHWVLVHLSKPTRNIKSIKILNRAHCFQDRWIGATVQLLDQRKGVVWQSGPILEAKNTFEAFPNLFETNLVRYDFYWKNNQVKEVRACPSDQPSTNHPEYGLPTSSVFGLLHPIEVCVPFVIENYRDGGLMQRWRADNIFSPKLHAFHAFKEQHPWSAPVYWNGKIKAHGVMPIGQIVRIESSRCLNHYLTVKDGICRFTKNQGRDWRLIQEGNGFLFQHLKTGTFLEWHSQGFIAKEKDPKLAAVFMILVHPGNIFSFFKLPGKMEAAVEKPFFACNTEGEISLQKHDLAWEKFRIYSQCSWNPTLALNPEPFHLKSVHGLFLSLSGKFETVAISLCVAMLDRLFYLKCDLGYVDLSHLTTNHNKICFQSSVEQASPVELVFRDQKVSIKYYDRFLCCHKNGHVSLQAHNKEFEKFVFEIAT
ncbi:hypothetical protein EDD86DRAFT_213972 [Gorgonomyces haynaldii]|nr:hypothetical protein EDD86DRAFT_213972 [Gorgonomyces haynaldii]